MDVHGVVASLTGVKEELSTCLFIASIIGVLLNWNSIEFAVLSPVCVVVSLVEDSYEDLSQDAKVTLRSDEQHIGEF